MLRRTFIVILPGLLGLAMLDTPGHHFLVGEDVAREALTHGQVLAQLQSGAAHYAGACIAGPGLLQDWESPR